MHITLHTVNTTGIKEKHCKTRRFKVPSGLRLVYRKVLWAPGPRTKYFELLKTL